MTAVSELKETLLSPEISELKTLFSRRKDDLTIEEYNDIIERINKYHKGRYLSDEIYFYCKENHPEMIQVCKQFRNRTVKKDNHICIEGETGSGKSTLTLALTAIIAHMKGLKFNLVDNVLYIPKEKELSNKLGKLRENELLWVDETIKSLNKQKWFNQDAIESNELVQTERFRHNTVFYCVPSFYELTKSFRQVNIKFRIWCINCEQAFLRVKEIDPDIKEAFGAWHTAYRAKYKVNKKINGLSSIRDRIRVEQGLPGHITNFTWPDLENIPEFAGYHLLYEVYKSRSRLIYKKQTVPPSEQAKTKTQYKQKELIINFMAALKKNNTKFKDYYKTYGQDATLSIMTQRRYWDQAGENEAAA